VAGRMRARRVGHFLLGVVAVGLGLAIVLTVDRGGPPEQPPRLASLGVATYNINVANTDRAPVVDAILESQADIVALQEVSPQAEAFLTKQLASHYPYMAFEGSTATSLAARFGFISKYRIIRSRYLEPQYGRFGVYLAVFELDHGAVQLANVHLEPLDAALRRRPAGLIRAALATEDTHLAEIEWICQNLEPGIPTVVLGDFNSLSFFKAPAFLRDIGFVDSFASVHTEAHAHPTWHRPTSSGTIYARIDYIFHDTSFRTLESRVASSSSSDHFLLVSRLAFVEPLD
jgi:endonuclease/exonuclease/phosphatase family metal-dependent hydrolase